MKEKICCFTGHRKIPERLHKKIYKALYKTVEQKILDGVLYFGVGGALGFDSMAEAVILELKKKYPDIKLILVLPCPDQDKFWGERDKAFLRSVIQASDKVTYAEPHYTPSCMHKRNRHLVEQSGHCICYLTEESGGTAYTVSYAREHGLDVTNIADLI